MRFVRSPGIGAGHTVKWFAALMVALGLHSESALARTLDVELALQHVGGMFEPAEPDAWLASPELEIEALYQPLKLIEGKTAKRIRTMPIGSRLEPILHTVTLRGAQIERTGRTLRFRLDEQPPMQEPYRLFSVYLRVPISPGIGRPQPALHFGLLHEPATMGAHQAALVAHFNALDLGARLRYRWNDAPADWRRHEPMCGGDAREVDSERYRFRVRHRHLGLFQALRDDAASDPPTKPPAGWTSFQMREPYVAPIAGWRVSRNHLIRLDVPGGRVDRLSIYAEQTGPGQCRHTRSYDALFSGDQLVRIERSIDAYNCDKRDQPSQIAHAEWGEDGSLSSYMEGSGANPTTYDAFSIGQPAACGALAAAPDAAQVNALIAEVNRLRLAFLAH